MNTTDTENSENNQNTENFDFNFNNTYFMTSAAKLSQCPEDQGLEIAFAGRSNAGKSSLINTLCAQKKLARTSKTPGRTQLLNFFTPDKTKNYRLVDLPGYGYAKVSKKMREQWDKMLSDYLCERKSLKKIILIMDIRHPLQAFDTQMIDWAIESNMPIHLVLTKADKLKFGAAKAILLKIMQQYQQHELITCQLFSALKKMGIDELAQYLLKT